MLAVFVNCGAIIIGSVIGLLFSRKISKDMSQIVQTGAGIITLVIGLQSAFKYQNIIFFALSLLLGGLLGSWLDIDGKILAIGNFIEKFSGKKKESLPETELSSEKTEGGRKDFGYGFLNASVLYCVGAMAILGSLKAGIEKDYTIIFTKSVLDGFMGIVFASSLGAGALFSFIMVFLYQGLLTVLSTLIAPFISEAMLAEITGVGGALIVMIGINLLELKKIKTANYLPAVIFAVLFVLFSPYLPKI